MASGYIEMPSADEFWRARLYWSSEVANTNNNTTTINLTLQVYRNNTLVPEVITPFTGRLGINDANGGELLTEKYISTSDMTVPYLQWITISSLSYAVPHNAQGQATVVLQARCRASVPAISFTAPDTTVALPTIRRYAYITSVSNFTDIQNPTIKYSNPHGATDVYACISFTGAKDDVPYRRVSSSGGSYTFDLTAAERETLIKGITSGTSTTLRFYMRSSQGGVVHYQYKAATFSLTDALPYLEPVVVDMNNTTAALTGDINTLVKYFSDAACQTNAIAKAGAAIISEKITNGGVVEERGLVRFVGVENPVFEFEATDNRGNTSTATITCPMVEYIKPTCNQKVEIELSEETSAILRLKISGSYFNQSFGAADNELKIEVRHTQNDGTMGDWVELTDGLVPILKDNTYTLNATISGLEYDRAYTIQCRASDKLDSVESSEYTARLVPVFDWGENDFNFNVPVSFQGDTMADFVIEEGTEAMGSNGTWYWSKWKSGKAECYGKRNYGNMAVNSSFSGFYYSATFSQDLPSGLFAAAPEFINISVMSSNSGGGSFVERGRDNTASADSTGSFCLMRPASATLQQVHLGFHCIGRWK